MRQAQRTIERAQRQAEYEAGLSYVKAGVAMVTAATAMSEADFAAWLEPLGLDQEQVRKNPLSCKRLAVFGSACPFSAPKSSSPGTRRNRQGCDRTAGFLAPNSLILWLIWPSG